MQVIIKPTARCNFNCEFCSAKFLDIKHDCNLPDIVKKQLDILKPDNIIVTGGEPLLVGPTYFKQLLEYGVKVSVTSNLWDWYNNIEKWDDLFKNPNFLLTTSFQFGSKRKLANGKTFDLDMFKTIMKEFRTRYNYSPVFISVIDESNADKVLDTVKLAQELNTVCRVNNCLPMGASTVYYPRYKMLDHWFNIIDFGLEQYEVNCRDRKLGTCNFNVKGLCSSTIRVLWIDNKGVLQYNNCEDLMTKGQRIELDKSKPEVKSEIKPFKTECLSCELCRFCNGCRFNSMLASTDSNYCFEMKKRLPKLKEQEWLL